jgi:hypothetical protein
LEDKRMIRKILLALFAVIIVIAMVLSGCGGPDGRTETGGDASGYPVDVQPKGPADTAYPGP